MREVALFCLIALTAVLANLPADYVTEELGVRHDYLLAALGCATVIGLFLYLRFFFFFAVVLLFLGANMPEQIAQGFGISKIPLILALVSMVGISLINYVVKLLPTGLEPKPKEKSPEGVRAMFYAIEKNNVPYGQRVMSMNFDPNLKWPQNKGVLWGQYCFLLLIFSLASLKNIKMPELTQKNNLPSRSIQLACQCFIF